MTIETQTANPIKTTKPHRWFRFRLRSLLILITLLSVPLGWIGLELDQRRKEKVVVSWIEEMGGEVTFYSSFPNGERSWWKKRTDKWFGERVQAVDLSDTHMNDLSPLSELKNLEFLDLRRTQVSKEQVQELQQALQNRRFEY